MTDRSTNHWSGRHYGADDIAGPVAFLNPTTRFLSVHRPTTPSGAHSRSTQAEAATATAAAAAAPSQLDKQNHSPHTGIYTVWRSRDNRKGRHALALTPSAAEARTGGVATPPKRTDSWAATLAGIGRMLMRYPVWDVSYDVAIIFTLGSIVWVCNGFFVLLPLTNPADTFSGESAWGGGVSAVVGATIFELGSVLLMIEAVNENRSECFGWALEEALEHSEGDLLLLKRDKSTCRHHHAEKSAWLTRKSVVGSAGGTGEGDSDGEKPRDDASSGPAGTASDQGRRTWTWWPSWYELRTHYLRDIGFLACLSQMFGATVFWISGFTGLPQILNVLTVPATNGIYWLPQVVGGTGFIVSSWLFMLETQSKWWMPAPTVLGWHIGFWNLIGALGFTLCGAFGFGSSNEACEIALTWSTFIGSWAFLIGSVLQWYESVDKYPVVIDKTIPQTRTSEEFTDKTHGKA